MNGLTVSFAAAALSGLCSQPAALAAKGEPHHLTAEQLAARALAIGKAMAALVEAEKGPAEEPPRGRGKGAFRGVEG